MCHMTQDCRPQAGQAVARAVGAYLLMPTSVRNALPKVWKLAMSDTPENLNKQNQAIRLLAGFMGKRHAG